ncbi:MAG: hypothetical protein DI598_12455, partial [Pseudopedobacter saltans]
MTDIGQLFFMKKNITFVVVVVSLLILTACNSEKGKIKTVITSFFTALNHKDPQSAKLYATNESADFLNLIQQQIIQTNSGDSTPTANEKFLISDIKINGDVATASVRSESQQNPLTVTVKKVNGDWKVAFDKSSIASMINSDVDLKDQGLLHKDSTSKDIPSDQNNMPTAPRQTLNLADTSVTPANN